VLRSRPFALIARRYRLIEKRVLDIGCGFGEYMQRFGSGSVGITATPEEVAYGASIGRDIRLGNAEKLEELLSPNECFVVFWANNIFEHLLSPHAFLVSLKRWAHFRYPSYPWNTCNSFSDFASAPQALSRRLCVAPHQFLYATYLPSHRRACRLARRAPFALLLCMRCIESSCYFRSATPLSRSAKRSHVSLPIQENQGVGGVTSLSTPTGNNGFT